MPVPHYQKDYYGTPKVPDPDELCLFNSWTELKQLIGRDEPPGRLLLVYRPIVLAALNCLDRLQTHARRDAEFPDNFPLKGEDSEC